MRIVAAVVAGFVLLACSSSSSSQLHAASPAASLSPGPSAAPSPSATGVPTLVAPTGGDALLSMRMTSLSVMWAASDTRVLRSTDAGRHWTGITPENQSNWSAFFAVDDGAAWAVRSDFNSHGYTVWRTVDGGATWRSYSGKLIGGSVTNIFFLDRLHGWIVDNLGAAAGSEGVAILRSIDGGATWIVIAESNDPTTGQGTNGIEFGCDKGAVTFGSVSVGLLTTTCAGGPPTIYRTTDGGYHWHEGPLPQLATTQYGGGTENAAFLTATDAFVFAEYYNNGPVYGLVVTRDGGATWTARRLPGSGTVDFESPLSGWQLNDSLSATSDGGRTWRTIGGLPFKGTEMTLQYLGKGIATAWDFRQTAAYRTDDGGRTWRSVAPPGLR